MFIRSSISAMLVCTAFLSTPLTAATMDVSVELPQIETHNYRRPYVAIWIETFNQEQVAHLAVWYKTKAPNNKGLKWLPDLSHWWKRGGKDQKFPIDGVTGATRGPGVETLHFDTTQGPLKDLKPGKYYLSLEAAREHTKQTVARERVMISFTWPPTKAELFNTKGTTEIGAVSLNIAP
ncbi:hypothetical protein LX59_02487 [Azomonas agilis]|uniref:DUF2271 domain-containing protein n=1 Tax=Azomonas agilis TaxID=116849 RepID=A0A562I0N5_9GAMM|nr:DUF2271 domain-containing protein [Azomonas agilis]TWH64284.1 hypothetical protein LX59_02487 [Azomonas agilis]